VLQFCVQVVEIYFQIVTLSFCLVNVIKNVKNFYDIRNELVNSIDSEAKAKNAAFVASIPATPPPQRRSGLACRILSLLTFLIF